MGACADALTELRGIADRLRGLGAFGNELGLQSEQIKVVELIQRSPCEALKALAGHVQHDRPERVFLAWKKLVEDGLEPSESTLPKVATIYAQLSGGVVPAISTSELSQSAPKTVPMNPWIGHAQLVVAVLIARVERVAKAEAVKPQASPDGMELWSIARAAAAVPMRPDVLLNLLRTRGVEVFGAKRTYSANPTAILSAIDPKKRKQVKRAMGNDE